jgi:hypothetical protein
MCDWLSKQRHDLGAFLGRYDGGMEVRGGEENVELGNSHQSRSKHSQRECLLRAGP